MSPTLRAPARSGRRRWITRAGLGVALAATSWYGLKRPEVQRADVLLGDALRGAGSPLADRVVAATTDLGSVYAVTGIAATLAAAGRPRAAADVAGVGTAAWFGAQNAKTWVRRARPYEAHGVRRLITPPAGSSFPSGHAAVAAAVMTVLAGHAPDRRAGRLLAALAAYVAASRVYVGVHYPTDVLGGAGIGLALGSAWRGPVAAASRRLLRTLLGPQRGLAPAALRLGVGLAAAAAARWAGDHLRQASCRHGSPTATLPRRRRSETFACRARIRVRAQEARCAPTSRSTRRVRNQGDAR